MEPPLKKRRAGRPSNSDIELRLKREEQARIDADIEEQLEALEEQVRGGEGMEGAIVFRVLPKVQLYHTVLSSNTFSCDIVETTLSSF